MYTGNTYILLFFIYGLAFFSMGISALQQRTLKDTDLPLLRSVKLLGFFGITHGIVEWLLMIIIWNQYPSYSVQLFFIKTFLNAVSFTFLWMFGIKLFEDQLNQKAYLKILPVLVFCLWIMTYLWISLFNNDSDRQDIYLFTTLSRYLIALPGGITACIGLYRSGNVMYNLKFKKIAVKFKILALLFGVYGILAGLIVRKHEFFPANIINIEMFREQFGFPVELARTIAAIAITVIFINVIDIFMWEAEYKIEKLTKQQLIGQERRKLGHELHDTVIQNLFAAGLVIENLIENKEEEQSEKLLNIRSILNEVINEIRGFISKSSIQNFSINDFRNKLIELVAKLEKVSKLDIVLDYKASEMTLGHLSSQKLEQIYYIIQEAVNNAIKHSEGSKIRIDIKSNLKALKVSIRDNGRGICLEKIDRAEHFGLISMRERALSIKSELNINSESSGVTVTLTVPWEAISHGE